MGTYRFVGAALPKKATVFLHLGLSSTLILTCRSTLTSTASHNPVSKTLMAEANGVLPDNRMFIVICDLAW